MHRSTLLQQSPHLWLSVNRRDGPPHTTPLWFVHEGSVHRESLPETSLHGDAVQARSALEDAVWASVAAGSRKAALISMDPRVSLAIEGTAGEGGLVGEGAAELFDVATRPDIVSALAAKYGGWDAGDQSVVGPRILLRITVSRWLLELPPPP